MKRVVKSVLISNLVKSSLWSNYLNPDCLNEKVFLTIRQNRIDLYHRGGKLFSFDDQGFKTHIKYAAVIPRSKEDYLTESDLAKYSLVSNFEPNYSRIKENCKNYSGIEAFGVSHLYHNHSYLSNENVVVLDIEISFDSLAEDKQQDRIDIVLYNKELRTLQFVEAKHYSNKELWSTSTPKVVDQIDRYQKKQISKKKTLILKEYSKYIETINSIFGISLPTPLEVQDNVKLLIFGFDQDQKQGRLTKQILKNVAYNGIKIYSIGDIKKIVPENCWKA